MRCPDDVIGITRCQPKSIFTLYFHPGYPGYISRYPVINSIPLRPNLLGRVNFITDSVGWLYEHKEKAVEEGIFVERSKDID